jgi:hypothetical protein
MRDATKKTLQFLVFLVMVSLIMLGRVYAQGQPGYEPAYVDGQTVTINAIDIPNHAPLEAQADFYLVVYPTNWQALGLAPPQCDPCDHEGNGIDFTDFHDHVLDSMPALPGHGEYSPLWHVNLVLPAYTWVLGLPADDAHDAAVSAAYAGQIPTKSEAAVDGLLGLKLPDGSPVAIELDTGFYFLCSVVDQRAAH